MIPERALSVRQPMAWLLVHPRPEDQTLGLKDIENRTWRTSYRGRICIHGGLVPMSVPSDLCQRIRTWDARERAEHYIWNMLSAWRASHGSTIWGLGALVGEVDIVDCVTESDSPWFEGPYGLVVRNPLAYETPIPCKGKLGMFRIQ